MKVILIDEDLFALKYLIAKLNQLYWLDIIGVFTDPLMVKEAAETKEVDLVFLAVETSSFDGMKLAEELTEMDPDLPLVLIAKSREHAVRAFEINVFDYLIKPVDQDRLRLTVERVENEKKYKKKVFVRKFIDLEMKKDEVAQ